MSIAEIRPYNIADADELSQVIIRCLLEVNSKDYSGAVIEGMVKMFSPEGVSKLADERKMYVAERDGKVIGTVSRVDNKIYTMFINPSFSRQGIGNQLMDYAEEQIRKSGHDLVELDASITARNFYKKRGYSEIEESSSEEYGSSYQMQKSLVS